MTIYSSSNKVRNNSNLKSNKKDIKIFINCFLKNLNKKKKGFNSPIHSLNSNVSKKKEE